MIKAVFFDAAGTLFHLNGTVGEHYALVGREVGLELNAEKLDHAFHSAWKRISPRPAIDGSRENDDKDWWRDLVEAIFDEVAPSVNDLDRDNFFEVAYEHFTEAGVWQLYPEVFEVLRGLSPDLRLAVVSNFDGRLRMILEQLGVSKFFTFVFISSEIGADKPDPEIFRRALTFMDLPPGEVLHAGDDPERDWKAAEEAGLTVFRVRRPQNSLRDLLADLRDR
jgi:putative hydrolase of the HAD superfamily